VRTLAEQIRDAFERSEMSLAELLRRSGLGFDRANLSRRMAGEVPLRTGEAEALATALGINLVWAGEKATEGAA
jgi:transcriptional regulator with XRE-family HTH domain